MARPKSITLPLKSKLNLKKDIGQQLMSLVDDKNIVSEKVILGLHLDRKLYATLRAMTTQWGFSLQTIVTYCFQSLVSGDPRMVEIVEEISQLKAAEKIARKQVKLSKKAKEKLKQKNKEIHVDTSIIYDIIQKNNDKKEI